MNKGFVTTVAAVAFLLADWVSLGNAQTTRATQEAQLDQENDNGPQILVGRVVLEGGSAQAPDTAVVLECGGSEQLKVNTTVDGSFMLNSNAIQTSFSDSSTRHHVSSMSSVNACVLYADAPGYTSERSYVEAGVPGITNVGRLVLHPLGPVLNEDATVSVASLAVPGKAKKVFEKGQQESKKKNWKSACEYFRRAVEMYPRYALAWLQLGRAQLQQNELAEAQKSFQRATTEDTHFIAAYIELAELGAKQKEWNLVAGTTDHVVQLAPGFSPKVWFFNSVSKLNMGDVASAENSVKEGLKLDVKHEAPQLEYLYGIVLARKGQYDKAVEHITTYLRLAPHAADQETAEAALSKIKQLASTIPQHSSR